MAGPRAAILPASFLEPTGIAPAMAVRIAHAATTRFDPSEGVRALHCGHLKRLSVVVVVLSCLCAGPVRADEPVPAAPTPSQLHQGLELYEQGQYDAAKDLLRQVDPMQLPSDQRVLLYQALQDIDRRTHAGGDASAVLAQADQARADGLLPRAIALYDSVASDEQADASVRSVAQARLAESARALYPDQTAAKAGLAQAEAELAAGMIDDAKSTLKGVTTSGVELGWFDQDRVTKLQQALDAQNPAPAADLQPAPDAPVMLAQADTPATDPQLESAVAPEAPQAEPAAEPAAPVAETAAESPAPTPDLLSRMRVVYAQQKIAEARAAAGQGQQRAALDLYEQALQLDPANPEAQTGRDAAAAAVSQPLVPTNLLQEQQINRSLGAEMTAAEFNQLVSQAQQQLTARNFTAAQELVAQAKVLLDRNQRFIPAAQYQQLREQAVLLGSQVADQEQLARAQQQEEILKQRQADSEQRRSAAMAQTDREVQRLLARANELRREFKYDEALQVVDQALFLDPNNPATQLIKEMIQDNKIYVSYRQAQRQQDLSVAGLHVDNLQATVFSNDLVTYPSDWPALTAKRLGGIAAEGADSEINRKTSAKLKQTVPINFDAQRLDTVFNYLRNVGQVEFYINWPALAEAGIEPDSPITINLDSVTIERALQLVLDQLQVLSPLDPVSYTIADGYVHISTRSNLQRTTEIRVYDIRDLLVQVPNFTDAPAFDLNTVLQSSGDGGGGSPFTENEDDVQEPTREERVTQITTLIQDTVGQQDEWALYGGDQSSLQELNGNLIIKTTPQNHRSLYDLLSQIREAQALQIHVEGRFLLVDHNFLEEIGIDFDTAWGSFNFTQDSINMAGRGAIPDTGVGQSFANPNVLNNRRSMDVNFNFLDDLELSVLLRMTQANRRSLSLTAPRLTFFNGQRAYVLVATQSAFVSDLEPVADSTGFDVTLSVVNTGAILDVEGTVSSDRRYVTLTLRPSLATLKNRRTVEQSNIVTNDLGEVTAIGTASVELPELELTEVNTTIRVPDKGTLLLGGQRLLTDIEVQAGVPVLSKIPVLNRFFTNSTKVKDERTLLILIKPTIILQTELEDDLYPGLLSNPQEYNVGQRF
ncbi:MAG: hypothetical protein IT442_01725 [Phycisphaeraceae bacterium]|nr:hypothetical protein [Phycisphaeraceae bacterium]